MNDKTPIGVINEQALCVILCMLFKVGNSCKSVWFLKWMVGIKIPEEFVSAEDQQPLIVFHFEFEPFVRAGS